VWGSAGLLDAAAAEGRVVVLRPAPLPDGRPGSTVARDSVTARFQSAAGIVVASLDDFPAERRAAPRRPAVRLADTAGAGSPAPGAPLPTFLYVTRDAARRHTGFPLDTLAVGTVGRTLVGNVAFVEAPVEALARNVVAVLPGSDSALRGQYVAIGAHSDHDGIAASAVDHDSLRAYNRVMRREGAGSAPATPTAEQLARIASIRDSLRRLAGSAPARADSIFNGADDDGSGSVALLEIAEAFASQQERPRRSMLFVWHTAEELGLYGSQYFTDHPTVPRDSIVAQLNIDMVGRGGAADLTGGGPRYLQLIGSRRLSTGLGDLVESINRSGRHDFIFDYQYDADGHPENYYCRSDHYMYARYGIPIVFFTTGGHPDYHMVTDEPQYIDYEHMARVARLIDDIARDLAGRTERPVVDKPKPDPHGVCRQ
jgi:hypothetical protein